MEMLSSVFDYIAKDSIHFIVFMVTSILGSAWVAGKIAEHRVNPDKKEEKAE